MIASTVGFALPKASKNTYQFSPSNFQKRFTASHSKSLDQKIKTNYVPRHRTQLITSSIFHTTPKAFYAQVAKKGAKETKAAAPAPSRSSTFST
jgi:hypothetical protein